MTTTAAPATLATNAKGVSIHIYDLKVGQYIWHKGAFRLVTAVDGFGRHIRMGRHALHCKYSLTVEGAPV